MNVRALPAGLRRFALEDVSREPWRNRGGWTRTVAVAEVGAEPPATTTSASAATTTTGTGRTPPHWRVSAADITQDGPFSVFEGLDRTAVLLDGPGLKLVAPQATIAFEQVGDLAAFPGEMPLQAHLGTGPARLWNVMVERSRWRADVQLQATATARVEPGAHAVILVLSGTLLVDDAEGTLALSLHAEEGLVLNRPLAPLHLHGLTPDTRWIHTALEPL